MKRRHLRVPRVLRSPTIARESLRGQSAPMRIRRIAVTREAGASDAGEVQENPAPKDSGQIFATVTSALPEQKCANKHTDTLTKPLVGPENRPASIHVRRAQIPSGFAITADFGTWRVPSGFSFVDLQESVLFQSPQESELDVGRPSNMVRNMVGPSGLEPLTSTVSILKMRVAAMSSSSGPGSIHAGFMTLARHLRQC